MRDMDIVRCDCTKCPIGYVDNLSVINYREVDLLPHFSYVEDNLDDEDDWEYAEPTEYVLPKEFLF